MNLKRAAILVCSCIAGMLSGGNLLENPSFETVSGDFAVKWKRNMPENFENVEFKLSDEAKDGVYSAQIVSRNPATETSHFLALIQDIDMNKLTPYTPGKELLLSFDYRTDAPGTRIRAYVEGRAMGKSFNRIGESGSRYVGWGTYQLRFHLPEQKPDMMYVVLQLLTTGSVKIDNVKLETDPPPAESTPAAQVVKEAKTPELDLHITKIPFGNLFIAGKGPMEIEFVIPMKEDRISGVKTAIVDCADGKTVSGRHFTARGNHVQGKVRIPAELKSGCYKLVFRTSLGKKPVEEEVFFRIASGKEAADYPVRFRDDGIMLLHGKPFFPIAVCPPFNNRDAYKAYRQAGFNTITPQVNASATRSLAPRFYSNAAEYGLNVIEWVNFADTADRSKKELAEHVAAAAENMKAIPNFIGWMNDEDAWRGIPLKKSKRAYEAFFRNAPGRIYWVNQAPRGTIDYLRKYVRYSDVTGADVYPIPEKVKHSEKQRGNIACMGDYTDDFLEIGNCRKPVWMILQAWSWGGKDGTPDKPFPTYGELRFMFYNCITHGATGIAWFDDNTMAPDNKVFVHLGNINHEFHAVERFILDGSRTEDFTCAGNAEGIRLLERTLDGKKLLIVVNENDSKAQVSINAAVPVRLFDTKNRKNFEAASTLNFEMEKFEVLLLTTEPVSFQYPEHYEPMGGQERTPLAEAVANRIPGKTRWKGNWIWNGPMSDRDAYCEDTVVKTFTVTGNVKSAWVCTAADNEVAVSLNGKMLDRIFGWKFVSPIDLKPYLKQGENKLQFHVVNYNSFGGVVFEGEIETDGEKISIVSDENCKFEKGKTHVYGKVPVSPWRDITLFP